MARVLSSVQEKRIPQGYLRGTSGVPQVYLRGTSGGSHRGEDDFGVALHVVLLEPIGSGIRIGDLRAVVIPFPVVPSGEVGLRTRKAAERA